MPQAVPCPQWKGGHKVKDSLSMRNACAIIVVIQVSNVIILGFPSDAGGNTWISILLSTFLFVPLMLIYARLVHLMPGKNIFEMMESVFGRVITIIICLLYAYYFMTLTGIVRGNYAEFVHIVALKNTPFIVITLSFFIVCSFLAYSGTKTMGKWCVLVLIFSVIVLGGTVIFSIPKMKLDNLMLSVGSSLEEIGITALKFLPLPFGEAIILMTMSGDFEKKVNPYKLFLTGAFVSVGLCLLVYLSNCAVLGQKTLEAVYFPSFKAASVVHIGSVGTRIEAIVAFAFIMEGITKVAASLTAGARAVAMIFNIKKHRMLIYPIGFLTVAFSSFVFHNILEMLEFTDHIYRLYAPFFQILVPLATLITAEIKIRKRKQPIRKVWEEVQEDIKEAAQDRSSENTGCTVSSTKSPSLPQAGSR